MAVDSALLRLARQKVAGHKRAFVPAGDPAMGGAPPGAPPPGDPMAGGAPPGMPPDPAMMGAPPGDPAAMGGAPPPMPPMPDPAMPDPAMAGAGGGGGDVRSIIREELTSAGLLPQGGQTAPGAAGKPVKPDINTIATDVFQLKKMFLHFLRMQQIDLPPDVLDGPNRDPATGAPAAAASGGSDVGASPAGPAAAFQPIQPIQPAMAPAEGGGEKAARLAAFFTSRSR